MVPRIIHHIWVGPDPIPREFRGYVDSWRRHHPDWEMRMWTEDNFPEDLVRPEARERLRIPAERADILRLEVLYRYGGVYLDTDFECRRPLDGYIKDLDFFTAYLKPNRVNNAFIGALPGHPILERALREIQPREFYGYDKSAAGPLFLDRLLKEYPDVFAFEPRLFYPSTPAEEDEAIAIHHHARSWKDAAGFRQATLVAEERLREANRTIQKLERRQARTEAKLEALTRSVAKGRRGRIAMLAAALRRPR